MTDPAAILDRWSELFAAKDGPGLAALYSPTAMFYGSTPELRRGQDEIAGYFEAQKNAPSPAVEFRDAEFQTVAPGVVDMACIAAFSFGGGPAILGRFTWTLVKQDGRWRIASHHASPMPG